MRWIGILGILAALVTGSAYAMDANRSCLDLLEENDGAKVSPAQDEQPLLTDNQCEAMKSRELRVLLLEVPQEEEDPMALSLGIKNPAASYFASRYRSVSNPAEYEPAATSERGFPGRQGERGLRGWLALVRCLGNCVTCR